MSVTNEHFCMLMQRLTNRIMHLQIATKSNYTCVHTNNLFQIKHYFYQVMKLFQCNVLQI